MTPLQLALEDSWEPPIPFLRLEHLLRDRGSVYSATAWRITHSSDFPPLLQQLRQTKQYAKATHHSSALRVAEQPGVLYETKQDDGETGAGMVILRQLRASMAVNIAVVVTRWYGGTRLGTDRYRHVQDATQQLLAQLRASATALD
ncbi:YigZ family protein [Candidatus Peribacteria bacterium]|nr:YigZ family protein [Candidatus Peribacteria bacterium]